MRRLKVGVIDLVGNRPAPGLWNRVMKPNFASIMPQAIAAWCEDLGHEVTFVCETGAEDLDKELLPDLDLLFVAAFTNAAQRAALAADGTVVRLMIDHPHCKAQAVCGEQTRKEVAKDVE